LNTGQLNFCNVRFKKERGGNYGGLRSPPIGGSRDPQRVAAQRKNPASAFGVCRAFLLFNPYKSKLLTDLQ